MNQLKIMKLDCLDIGCGFKKPQDDGNKTWVGVDIRPFKGVDYVLNIGTDKLPFKDSTFDFIQAIHVFEHLYPEELFHIMDEAWRVLKPLGVLHIEVPKYGTKAWFIHPDHKIHFVEDTFGFWQVPSEGLDPHGYTKRYFHVSILKDENQNPEAIYADLYPNKEGGTYEFKQVYWADGTKADGASKDIVPNNTRGRSKDVVDRRLNQKTREGTKRNS